MTLLKDLLESVGVKKKKLNIMANGCEYVDYDNGKIKGSNERLAEINTLSISIDEEKAYDVLVKDVEVTGNLIQSEIRRIVKKLVNTDGIIKIGRAE